MRQILLGLILMVAVSVPINSQSSLDLKGLVKSIDAAKGTQAKSNAQKIKLNKIVIKGNNTVKDSVILGRLRIPVGRYINEFLIRNKAKSINSLGYFEDVKVKLLKNNTELLITVVERPVVESIEFVGNKHISDETLLKITNVNIPNTIC